MSAAPDASLLATKRIVYVGGLGEEIKEDLIRAAFIPFGNIKSIMMVSLAIAPSRFRFTKLNFSDLFLAFPSTSPWIMQQACIGGLPLLNLKIPTTLRNQSLTWTGEN